MLETGTILQDRFLIEKELAHGGMGAVYLARDQKFGSCVAIKQRVHEGGGLAEAFEREARLLNTLHHPILPHVSDYFSEGRDHFLVMEFIEGADLSEVLKRDGAFAVDNVVTWTLELLDGLDYLHSQDPPVIHRDIKPGNLKLTSRGNIVLLDFGLAKESPNPGQEARSVFGYSRRYSPLEQIEGAGTDARSDIFSLGATIYHLITGQAPIDAIARASAIVAGRPDPLRSASEMDPDVSVEIADVIRQAMSMSPEGRFVSANAMKGALEYAVKDAEAVVAEAPNAPLIVPVLAPDAAPQFEHTEPPAGGPAIAAGSAGGSKVSEAVASANAAVHAIPGWVARKRDRMRSRFVTDRSRHRPREFVAALVLAALLAVGFVVYSWTSSRPAAQTPTVQTENVAAAEPETSEADESAVPDAPASAPANEVAATEQVNSPQPPAEEPKREKTSTAETKKSKKSLASTREEPEIQIVEELPEVTFEDPRMIARRRQLRNARRTRERVVYQAPASDIETIFTGLPARRRPWRKRVW